MKFHARFIVSHSFAILVSYVSQEAFFRLFDETKLISAHLTTAMDAWFGPLAPIEATCQQDAGGLSFRDGFCLASGDLLCIECGRV